MIDVVILVNINIFVSCCLFFLLWFHIFILVVVVVIVIVIVVSSLNVVQVDRLRNQGSSDFLVLRLLQL